LAVSRDGRQVIATSALLHDVFRWSLDNGKLTALPALLHVPNTEMVEAVALSPDGTRALLSHNPKIELWDLGTNKLSQTLPGHKTNNIPDVTFSPDGNLAASAGWDKLGHVWDLKTGAELVQFTGHSDMVHKVRFLPDSKRILSISTDATMRLWDATTGQELRRYQTTERGGLRELAISADGKRALTNGNGPIRAWDVDSGKEFQHFENQNDARDVALSPDGRLAVVFSRGRGKPSALTFYDLETGKECGQVSGTEYFAHGLAFTGDSTLIGSAIDGTLRLWQIEPVR
jgi:WD40 repeat protein